MTEPVQDPTSNDPPEPTMTSAVIDDIDVFEASDQWPTADLSDLDLEDEA
jgi:hypothetical protein